MRSYNTESRDQNTSQTSSSERCGGLAIDPLFGESQSSDARTVKAKNHAKSELNRGRTYQGKEEEKKKKQKQKKPVSFCYCLMLLCPCNMVLGMQR